jgi:hypothetical protein
VLVATKLTDEPTVLPLLGLVTVTPAKAVASPKINVRIEIEIRACFFILAVLHFGMGFETLEPVETKGIPTSGRTP